MGDQALNIAQRSMGQLRDSAADYAQEAVDGVHGTERALRKFVRIHPVKSALIGTSIVLVAGAGAILGRFWLRREMQQSQS